jgi:hypothetical protein
MWQEAISLRTSLCKHLAAKHSKIKSINVNQAAREPKAKTPEHLLLEFYISLVFFTHQLPAA